MSILKLLQQAQNGQGLNQLAAQFGLDEDKANQLAGMLAPAIGSATKQRAERGGLGDVLGALKGENQASMFDDASAAVSTQGQQQGTAFLEKILGSREQAQGLAQEAATRVGAEPNIVEQFLPALAAMVQGGLQKQMPDDQIDGMMGQLGGGAQASGGGLMGMIGGLLGGKKSGADARGGGFDLSALNNLLDADGDGSAMDDILGKFMR
ncbi:DUF937 domain-containing protein [Roseovarius sp. CH_XMU1461]|uniref:DUF937 domain-containing protein n=1 Tax=Roseovarius sp. CH_XMU1461 TaxID=3107777 RepID=UPI003009D8E8